MKKLVKSFQTMFRIFVGCFSFCLPSSSAAAAAAHDDGKQKHTSSSSSSPSSSSSSSPSSSSSSCSSSDHVTIEINHDNEEPRQPINNTRTLAMITGISLLFQQYEIGKTTMGYVTPIIVVLLINAAVFPHLVLRLVVIAFSLGFVIIWNGILFRNQFQRFGSVAEQVGVVVVFIGFFSLVAAVLPLSLLWVPLLCVILFLLPFLLSHCIFCGNTAHDLLPITAPTGELTATSDTPS